MATRRAIVTGQDFTGSGALTQATAGTYAQAAGDLMVVTVKGEAGNATISVADLAGNTFSPLTRAFDSGSVEFCQMFYCLSSAANANNVVTATFSTAVQYRDIEVLRYIPDPGKSFAFVAEAVVGGGGPSTSPLTSAFTAGDLAVAIACEFAGTSSTPTAGWTEQYDFSSNGTHVFDRIDSPGGTYTGSCTIGTSAKWSIAAASFSEAAPPAPTITTQPEGASAPVGGTATFTVAGTASAGSLTYLWQVSTDLGETWSTVSTGTGGTSASYTTAALVAADNGKKLRVVLTDSNGSKTSVDVFLHVSGLPNTGRGRRGFGSALWTRADGKIGGDLAGDVRLLRASMGPWGEPGANRDFALAWQDWFFPAVPPPPPAPLLISAFQIVGTNRPRPGRGPYSLGKYFRAETMAFGPSASSYAVAAADTGSAGDAATNAGVLVAAAADAASGTDAATSQNAGAAAAADTASAADAASTAATLAAAATDAGAAADTAAATGTFGSTASDAGSAADSASNAAVLPAASADAGVATDTATSALGGGTSVSASDSGSAADTAGTQATVGASAVDAGAAADSSATAATVGATATDAGSANDSATSALGGGNNLSAADNGTASDASSTSAVGASSATDAAAASDTATGLRTTAAAATDAGAASDSAAVQGNVYSVSAADGGSAADSASTTATQQLVAVDSGTAADASATRGTFAAYAADAVVSMDVAFHFGADLSEFYRYDVPAYSIRYDVPAAALRFDVPSMGTEITLD